MNYLEEFRSRIKENNFWGLVQLWEEYCCCDIVEGEELRRILWLIYRSPLHKEFGPCAESALSLWERLKEQESCSEEYDVCSLVFDLQVSNNERLGDLAKSILKERYGQESDFDRNLSLVGLKPMRDFRGALRNFELLRHLKKGNFVYHTAGWGAGEILDTSPVCEQASIEFENVSGVKHITFSNAFATLVPIDKDHFLAKRFGNADAFEEEAKKQPVETVRLLLKALGPKTALGIKDELCDLIIPQQMWSSWWQSTRSKLKKDDTIDCPTSPQGYFRLRKNIKPREKILEEALEAATSSTKKIVLIYSFSRDFPDRISNSTIQENLLKALQEICDEKEISAASALEAQMLIGDLSDKPCEQKIIDIVTTLEDVLPFFKEMSVTAFRKRILITVQQHHPIWASVFANIFLNFPQNSHKDFLLKQLITLGRIDTLLECLNKMILNPQTYPEAVVWFFQRAVSEPMPFVDKGKLCNLLEAVLVLLNQIENSPPQRELVRKIHSMLTSNRYLVIRKVIDQTSLDFLKEFLLLVSKCSTFSSHDLHIIQSLTEVVQPEVKEFKRLSSASHQQEEIVWTTQEGFERIKEKINKLYSDILKSANEIEDARALGDLRENSEFKFALERRGQLQSELRFLLDQMKNAQVINAHNISTESVQIGCEVHLHDQEDEEKTTHYTILGPWESDITKNIIAHQSKLAKKFLGKKLGEAIDLNGRIFVIKAIQVTPSLAP